MTEEPGQDKSLARYKKFNHYSHAHFAIEFDHYVNTYVYNSNPKNLSILNFLNYLKDKLVFTSDSKQEIQDALKRMLENAIDSSIIQSGMKKRFKKLLDNISDTFERKEIIEFFAELDKELEAIKNELVEEHISQEDLLNLVNETSNTFKQIKFPTYYNKLKTIWDACITETNYFVLDLRDKEILNQVHNLLDDCELESLFERLLIEDENNHMSKTAREYMMLFDQIIEESLEEYAEDVDAKKEEEKDAEDVEKEMKEDAWNVVKNDIKIEDKAVSEMEKIVHNLSGTAKKLRFLSNTIPIPVHDYNQSEFSDIHIIKIDGVAEFFERLKQIPLFLLEVSRDPSDLDPDKFRTDRHKLMSEGAFALNKFIIKTELPIWNVCKTLGIFLAQAFGDELEIGQIIYIDPGLYLFALFTIPNLIIPTSATNLEHKIKQFKKFERSDQLRIMKHMSKYTTGLSPGRPRTVTFSEFLPKEPSSKVNSNVQRNVTKGKGKG
ncbi:19146_t:CDS:2 [Racocetra fulgida]|uniref:19146_t:CDS:1 n=1 Tax=Racocetra fulgida TaxID=60492 RepID=A0A9N9F8X7_9GLOM|nr:19146_t:CDS:2 [Racocetra fulgida]